MSAVIVTAEYADALVNEAPNAFLTATKLADGRVRVESPGDDSAEDLAYEMREYAYRFGITAVEVEQS